MFFRLPFGHPKAHVIVMVNIKFVMLISAMLGRKLLQWEERGYRHALCDYLGRFGMYNVYNTDFFENMKLQV